MARREFGVDSKDYSTEQLLLFAANLLAMHAASVMKNNDTFAVIVGRLRAAEESHVRNLAANASTSWEYAYRHGHAL